MKASQNPLKQSFFHASKTHHKKKQDSDHFHPARMLLFFFFFFSFFVSFLFPIRSGIEISQKRLWRTNNAL